MLATLNIGLISQDQIKEFLEKKENNQLLIQKATNLLKKLLKPVSNTPFNDLMLHIFLCQIGRYLQLNRWLPSHRRCSLPHAQTQSVSSLRVYVSLWGTRCTSATHRQQSDWLHTHPALPQKRFHCRKVQIAIEIIPPPFKNSNTSYDSTAKVGDIVKYEQLITFTTLPDEGGQVRIIVQINYHIYAYHVV